jgi:hypothetical protein
LAAAKFYPLKEKQKKRSGAFESECKNNRMVAGIDRKMSNDKEKELCRRRWPLCL